MARIRNHVGPELLAQLLCLNPSRRISAAEASSCKALTNPFETSAKRSQRHSAPTTDEMSRKTISNSDVHTCANSARADPQAGNHEAPAAETQAAGEVVTTDAATETESDALRYPIMEPAFKLACDKILSFRREQGGRVPTGGVNATPNEKRLANLKRKLSMRCSKPLGTKPSERMLSAKESAYFQWCISDEEHARQGIPPEAIRWYISKPMRNQPPCE